MPRRSLHFRGFGVTVDVPERLGRAVRQILPKRTDDPSGERLAFRPPPPYTIDDHEGERAFISNLAAETSAAAKSDAADSDDVTAYPWYHTIELPDGTTTPGRYDHRKLLPHYGLPEDLHGKRALDVGSGDGFWAFELEKRGADVTSLDIETFADVDLPPALHDEFLEHPANLPFRRAFAIAHQRIGSRVKLINGPVYELTPDTAGTFDFVHAGDILLHLRDPALALQRLRSVCAGELLLADAFDPGLDELGVGPGLTRFKGGWDDAQWWSPAFSTLIQMVADAGFDHVQVLTTYKLDGVDSQGVWRAVIRARA